MPRAERSARVSVGARLVAGALGALLGGCGLFFVPELALVPRVQLVKPRDFLGAWMPPWVYPRERFPRLPRSAFSRRFFLSHA